MSIPRLGTWLARWASSGWAIVAPMLLVGLLGRIGLGRRSFWYDEVVTANTVRGDLSGLVSRIAFEPFNGFYYLLLKAWSVVGTNEIGLRSLSLVLGVATVPVVYRIARESQPHGAALLAASLMACNAFFIHYAQEARGYALAVFLASLATLALLVAARRPERRFLVAYAVVATLGLYAHFMTAFALAAHAAWLLASGRLSRRWLATLGAIAAAGAPIVPTILAGPERNWILAPTPDLTVGVLGRLTGGFSDPLVGVLLLGAMVVCLALSGWQLVHGGAPALRDHSRLTWLWLAVPLVGAWMVSFVIPIWTSRYLIVVVPPLALLVAAALWAIRTPAVRFGGTAIVLALALAGVATWYESPKEDWRTAADYVIHHAGPNDVMVFVPTHQRVPFTYYLGHAPTQRALTDEPGFAGRLAAYLQERQRRLWVVVSMPLPADIERLGAFEGELRDRFQAIDDRSFGLVRLVLYEPLPRIPAVGAASSGSGPP